MAGICVKFQCETSRNTGVVCEMLHLESALIFQETKEIGDWVRVS